MRGACAPNVAANVQCLSARHQEYGRCRASAPDTVRGLCAKRASEGATLVCQTPRYDRCSACVPSTAVQTRVACAPIVPFHGSPWHKLIVQRLCAKRGSAGQRLCANHQDMAGQCPCARQRGSDARGPYAKRANLWRKPIMQRLCAKHAAEI